MYKLPFVRKKCIIVDMLDANTSQPPEDLCIDDVIKFLTVRTEEKTEAILSL